MGGNSHEPVTSPPEDATGPELYVVGIGASSGGLTALQTLLGSMPADPGFACVIVVHLSPEHESHLPGLLQQHTTMPVQQVSSTVPLERNKVFVIPPNSNLDTIDTHLRLTQLEQRRIERAPIDHFLRTLAATHHGTAIGVILTGAGADGAIGLRHIKECGGLTIAQDPDEAEFDSMPRTAIASGVVDLVLPLGRIVDEVLRFCATRPQLPVPDENDQVDASDSALLQRIQHELRKWTQHDFTVYRRATLLRRLRRRMQLHHVTKFSAYLDVLAQRPGEAEALASDLLLVPSEFFRDQEGFSELERHIIPQILARKSADRDRVRAWSIGCSTGEEAYSLAMLLVEATARQARGMQLQIFASDSSEKLLRMAREGIYPREIAASVSPERLERFFTPQGGFFRVKRELHDIVLFASHNLFRDPPFGHIDLIVCCHLLCDLQPEVRRGVLSLFHYALEPGGILLVGPGDEVDAPELFAATPGPARIFRKSVNQIRMPALPASMQPFGPEFARRPSAGPQAKDVNSLYRSAIERYTPPSALINADNDVVHFSSNAAEYVQIPGGELTQNLTRLVREPLLVPLSEALRAVRGGSRSWSSEPFILRTEVGARRIVLHAEKVPGSGLILVVFEDRDTALYRPVAPASAGNSIASMQAEIEQLRGRLKSFLETKQEDGAPGDGARAHLQDAADELSSVLEELATSREELQAVNEELIALDDENRRRVRELTQISTDLQHLLASTGVATLFLDRDFNIVRFTPLLGELFGLRLSDIGRPLSDLTRLAQHERLEDDVRHVLEHAEPIDREVHSAAGRWYLSRILPYRTEAGNVEGVVLTLIDITERKHAEQALRDASRYKDEFLAVLAHELRNPLAPISSGVEVLKAATGDRHTVERIAATMGRQTRQLVRLVDDLLEVSRISGGKLRLHTSIIGLSEVVEDATSSVRPSIDEAGHTLSVNVTDEPLLVEGDAARLTQVLSNLLSNAVRYTPAPGSIVVTLARDGDTAVLSVKDNGEGIPPDTLTHVFEMFYQGTNTRPGPGAGLGIGLTLAKTLVELHKGTLTVTSPGKGLGSEFKLRLPLARRAEVLEQRAHQAVPLKFNGEHRILIVDDNVDAAETLCMLMKSLGEREVHTVCSGAEALQAAPELHPNIVLLDLAMPEMDGYEVARRMRGQPWGKNLLLVALSGWGHEEHRRRSKEAGFDRHVTKPADLAALQAVLNECRP